VIGLKIVLRWRLRVDAFFWRFFYRSPQSFRLPFSLCQYGTEDCGKRILLRARRFLLGGLSSRPFFPFVLYAQGAFHMVVIEDVEVFFHSSFFRCGAFSRVSPLLSPDFGCLLFDPCVCPSRPPYFPQSPSCETTQSFTSFLAMSFFCDARGASR